MQNGRWGCFGWCSRLLFLICFGVRVLSGQSASPSAAPSSIKLDYPDSASGLERLVKDILKAQQGNDGQHADMLLQSLVLPNPRLWYDQVFGLDVGNEPVTIYEKSTAAVAPDLAHFFLNATAQNLLEVRVVRFDGACDDKAREDVFGILHARIEPVPLYELRLYHGDKFVRLFAFAYVDGGFRYVLTPKMDGNVFHSPASNNPAAKPATIKELETRVRAGDGAVRVGKLVHKVAPEYPPKARFEHLEGTVHLRALIDKDGSVRRLYVIKGYCSLADSALKAVSQWRYAPTMFNGDPVEIDTEIQVVFSLTH